MTATRPINDDIVAARTARTMEERSALKWTHRRPGRDAACVRPRHLSRGFICVGSPRRPLRRERSSCQLSLPSCSSSCCNRRCEPCSGSTCRGALGALPLIGVLFCTLIAFATALSGPAVSWAQKLPEGAPRLQEHLSFLRAPIEAAHQFLQRAEDWFSGGQPSGCSSKGGSIGSGLLDSVFAGTRDLAGESFETVLVLFFLLVAGDTFLRRLVEILPRFSDKRQAIEISQRIEEDISAYLITISVMNAAVVLATAFVMWLCGLGDPVLWGAVAFMLNYIPILGPMIGIVTFALVGLLTADTLWRALLPAGLYLAIHIIEGETITPMLLARRFT
jgi:predicted PurR-regulated permease PerM